MSSREQKSRPSSPLAQVLKDYRSKYDLKQEQLASELNIDVRTLRRYENAENTLTDIRELRRIADVLGIDIEQLGILPDLATPEEIDAAISRVWALVRLARYREAEILVDRLIPAVVRKTNAADPVLIRKLANAQHVAGYIKSQTTRANQSALPLSHYREMEHLARTLNDQTLLNIALTYEGDMLQRGGDVAKAIEYLEAARDTTPLADTSARGNGIQLLGRAYFKAQRLADFERALAQAEKLAFELPVGDLENGAKGQYTVGTVYEEWGRSLGLLGQTTKAMEYLDKAEESFTRTWITQRRDILMTTARAMILVHGGEIQQGVDLAVASIDLCKKHGNTRLLDRIYGIQQYLDRLTKEIGHAGGELREALHGPIEY
ncbi:MAG: helix-turn-helix domain-containing protein [Ktedonobacteraceae bacterium]|nr:helix-turn-helix domain-containing protein [Ktedonobacteraceae bacterium]